MLLLSGCGAGTRDATSPAMQAAPEPVAEPTTLEEAQAQLEEAKAQLGLPRDTPGAAAGAARPPSATTPASPQPTQAPPPRAATEAPPAPAPPPPPPSAKPPPADASESVPMPKATSPMSTSSESKAEAAFDPCPNSCRALASMRRAVQAICRLTGDTDSRCTDARQTLAISEQRVSSCRCP